MNEKVCLDCGSPHRNACADGDVRYLQECVRNLLARIERLEALVKPPDA